MFILASRILQVRLRQGIKSQSSPPSQSEMARRLGITPPKYIRYESGKVSPPAEFLQKILEYDPEIDPAWLLVGSDIDILTRPIAAQPGSGNLYVN